MWWIPDDATIFSYRSYHGMVKLDFDVLGAPAQITLQEGYDTTAFAIDRLDLVTPGELTIESDAQIRMFGDNRQWLASHEVLGGSKTDLERLGDICTTTRFIHSMMKSITSFS